MKNAGRGVVSCPVPELLKRDTFLKTDLAT